MRQGGSQTAGGDAAKADPSSAPAAPAASEAETEAALAAAQAKAQDLLDQIHKERSLKIWPKIFDGPRRRTAGSELFQARHALQELEDKVFALKAGR